MRRTPVLAVLLSLAITLIGLSPARATAPDITGITVSNSTIYPLIGTAERPGNTTITVVGQGGTVDHLEVRDATNATVHTLELGFDGQSIAWQGRNANDVLLPAGTYTIVAIGTAPGFEESPHTAQLTISRQHLVRTTFTRTIAANRYALKLVGKCSTLRKPSRRGWAGSLGFYANTRCRTQTWNASRVLTLNATRLPAAERYVDLHIDAYGGGAKARPGSRGEISYFTNDTDLTAVKFVGSKVGWHNGLTRSAGNLVDSNGWVAWRFATAFKSKYDVAKFRVVVRYDVLSAS